MTDMQATSKFDVARMIISFTHPLMSRTKENPGDARRLPLHFGTFSWTLDTKVILKKKRVM